MKGRARPGIPWHKGHLYRLLNNPLYLGLVAHKDQTYPGEREAIIDRKLWDEAHKILSENFHARARQTRSKTPALLRGVIRCAHCNSGMGITYTAKKGRQYRYYLCVKADKHGYDTCAVKAVPAEKVEAAVIDQLRAVFRFPALSAEVFRSARIKEREHREQLSSERNQLEQTLGVMKTNMMRPDGLASVASELRQDRAVGMHGRAP